MQTLLLKSLLMIVLRPLPILESRNSKFVCNFAPVIVYDDCRSATAFADSISFTRTTASMGPLAHEDSTPELQSPDPELSEIRPGFKLKSFSIFFFCEVVSLSTAPRTVRAVVMDRQAVTRCDKRNSAPPLQSKWHYQYPVLHYLRQQIQAGFSSTCIHCSPCERFSKSRAYCVELRMTAKVVAASFQLGNFSFRPVQTLRVL